ncbi:MAG: Asp-tRNA(Asn)/Glu-tRNA(Gln) amidotransferase subunit GatB [Bacilli bacterium]|nr:Asp-tRNA(Asn)/Glu-tRNA(Gln) amidotransferase subunit GatB [Bacilli bacterium]
MEYDVTIGLEVHCEMKTNTKMFSPALNSYNTIPNFNIGEIDLAFPGTLPQVNFEAVKKSIMMALALNCKVPNYMYFDRKNYYYPDLPKGYQVTQAHDPVGTNGYLDLFVGDTVKRVYIHDIHLEEDTASLDHYSTYSLLDYNRCGVPLLETVTEPCLHSVDEALAFLDALRKVFIYCDVSEARTDRGQMRCDVNVSLAPKGSKTLGTRVEMKNINSFVNVRNAIECEIARQKEALENGEVIEQETRRYDDTECKTFRMRSKADAVDYKYFIDPNIPPFKINESLISEVKARIPALQFERINKYMNEYEISKYDATVLVKDREMAEYFDNLIANEIDAKTACNWVTTVIAGYLNKNDLEIKDLYLTSDMLAYVIKSVNKGDISGKQAKEVVEKSLTEKKSPKDIIKSMGMKQISDDATIRGIIVSILDAHQDLINEYHNGRSNVFDFFIGQVMKQTRGQANPSMTSSILKEEIDKR